MPLVIPSSKDLPITEKLREERVPVIDRSRAQHQDIRPLKIGLINLMPSATREQTEIQFFRLLGNTPLQIEPTLIRFDDYLPNTGRERMEIFYKPWKEIKKIGLDGLIVSGANLECNEDGSQRDFSSLFFYNELTEIISWAQEYVTSSIYCCMAAHLALEHFYKIPRTLAKEKIFGVFPHTIVPENHPEFLRGMNDIIHVPHARWGQIKPQDITHKDLEILMENPDCGWHMILGRDGREIYLQGHAEYDREDLVGEYLRDKVHGGKLPRNYFIDDDPGKGPLCSWKADASVFFRNWVNHVYQTTNFDLGKAFM